MAIFCEFMAIYGFWMTFFSTNQITRYDIGSIAYCTILYPDIPRRSIYGISSKHTHWLRIENCWCSSPHWLCHCQGEMAQETEAGWTGGLVHPMQEAAWRYEKSDLCNASPWQHGARYQSPKGSQVSPTQVSGTSNARVEVVLQNLTPHDPWA